jgi:small subunit ribosomal protein S20
LILSGGKTLATHKSSEKRARQDLKRAARNQQIRSAVKTWEKKVLKAAQEKSTDLSSLISGYTSKIMQAVARGAIKKQTASRKLGRVQVQANKLAK